VRIPQSFYPIRPWHIGTSDPGIERYLHGAFQDDNRNRVAFVIVWMFAEKGREFVPFSRDEFRKFSERNGQGPRVVEYLELLIRDGYIVKTPDGLRLTHEFIARCFEACPSRQYAVEAGEAT